MVKAQAQKVLTPQDIIQASKDRKGGSVMLNLSRFDKIEKDGKNYMNKVAKQLLSLAPAEQKKLFSQIKFDDNVWVVMRHILSQ